MIVLTRVDNRLIHGQIVQGWLPSLSVSEVVIVSPRIKANSFIQKMFRLALPGGYKLTVLEAKEAVAYTQQSGENIFVLIEDVSLLFQMLQAGFAPKVITLGNTQFEEGKKQYSQGVFLSAKEVKELKELESSKGIAVEIRSLPSSLVTKL